MAEHSPRRSSSGGGIDPTNDDGSHTIDSSHDAATRPAAPHSLDGSLSSSSSSSDDAQDAADRLFRDSEILAPMVRASTTPLRALALSHGATLVYTEELIDRSILQCDRSVNLELGTIDYRVPRSSYSPKVQKRMDADTDNPDSGNGAVLLRIDPEVERGRLVYQIGTGESGLALRAAMKVIEDVDGIDINMGCPKKFSVSGGMGSALLGDTRRACDILSTLRRNLGSKPVSAKVRLLHPTDPRPTLDFVRSLIKAGANAVAIHGRIVGDEGHEMARWGTLVEVIRQLKSTECVPIIANGDMYTRADILEMRRRSKCDGVMLARPALYNVSIFRRGEKEGDYGTTEDAVGVDVDNYDDDDDDERPRGEGEGGDHGSPKPTMTTATAVPLHQFQTTAHSGYHGYNSPLLHSRTSVVQEYIAQCVRYRNHSKNAKYVVLEMMNARRAPTNRVPYLDMTYEGGQTIASVCKCRSLDDLVRVWDVNRRTIIPQIGETGNGGGGRGDAPPPWGTTMPAAAVADDVPHNYDDRYFLDHDAFQRERTGADVLGAKVAEAATTAEAASSSVARPTRPIDDTKKDDYNGDDEDDNDEKKTGEENDDPCDVTSSLPESKRPKIVR